MTILTYYTEITHYDTGYAEYVGTEHEVFAEPCPYPDCKGVNLGMTKLDSVEFWQVVCNDCDTRGASARSQAAAAIAWNEVKR